MGDEQDVLNEYHDTGYAMVADAVDPGMLDEFEAAGRRALQPDPARVRP